MSGLYRGWWWAYLGGISVGLLAPHDWWIALPAVLTGVIAGFAKVDA